MRLPTPRRIVRALLPAAAFSAAVLFAAFPESAEARNAIAGRVVDRNGKPLERAIVTLAPGSIQLVTDAEGRFLIDYIRDEDGVRRKLKKKTEYKLEAFKPGYHLEARKFFYTRGPVEIDNLTLREDSLNVTDDGADLDSTLLGDPTQSTGATYEGQ
jgi:hypothetical protein